MRIIAFKSLREFWERPEYPDSELSLRAWYHDVKGSNLSVHTNNMIILMLKRSEDGNKTNKNRK